MAYPHLNMETERLVLDKEFIHATARVEARVLRDLAAVHRDHTLGVAKLHQELSPIADELLIGLSTYILKSQHVEKMEMGSIEVPKTWWDHVKQDALLSRKPWIVRLAKLFTPPEYETITVQTIYETRVCPHNDSYVSEGQQHLHFLMWKPTDGNRLEERT